MPKPYKLFLDTSVLLSGLNSPQGASGVLISLFRLRKIQIIVSPEVILEAERAIKNKFPDLATSFVDFISHKPVISRPITASELKSSHKIIPSEDAPIFAGARKSRAHFLITLDKRFLRLVSKSETIKPLSPGEFLQKVYKSR